MHKLSRPAAIPGGLNSYSHNIDTWCMTSPTPVERQAIWQALDAMQGQRCAYCEAMLEPDSNSRHVEHFRQRSRYRQGTFDWNNLFGSCNRQGTCGNYKDKCGIYDPAQLIKPDVDDPDDYLVFDSVGGVSPRDNLDPASLMRAKETIRILNLKGGGLRKIRELEIMGYLQFVEAWAELATNFPESEWRPIVESELASQLAQIAHLPYSTAIRHVLARIVA